MIRISRGADIPLRGAPRQTLEDAREVRSVALLGGDYVGMKPGMRVQVGDRVRKGQALFSDKKNPQVVYTSPAAGVVSVIHRGDRRKLVSVVIDVDDKEKAVEFSPLADPGKPRALSPEAIRSRLLETGLWTCLRARPFSRTPAPGSKPAAIFVTAMDTNPLAPDPAVILAEHGEDFVLGVDLIARLCEGPVHVCSGPGVRFGSFQAANVRHEEFSGPHPAGLAGTHIHCLHPVGAGSPPVWHLGYQDVIAIAKLFTTGELWTTRYISIAGPPVGQPRLLRSRLGANLEELAAGETTATDVRLISGSALSGTWARGASAFLGRYHNQLTILCEDRLRRPLGYLSPGLGKHSVLPVYLSKFLAKKPLDLTTTTNGSPRGMVPVGSYEAVMPLDILATQLLRALLTNDLDNAIALGCLELDEEDLALCTYACPAKYEYGPTLRKVLQLIEKEG